MFQSQPGNWKSYSLQRGSAAPLTEVPPPKVPSANPIYASTTNADGTVVIRRPGSANTNKGQQNATDDEDPYGRCTNMRLTSFADRDPRIIDLTLGTSPNSSQNGLNQARTGSPVMTYQQQQQNFNTLPAQVIIPSLKTFEALS